MDLLKRCLVIALTLFLLACESGANPLFGNWDVISIKADDLITQLSIDRYKVLQPKEIQFGEKEMAVTLGQGEAKKVPVQYKKFENQGWGFSLDGTEWHEVTVQDKDTLIYKEKKPAAVLVYTLKRKGK